MSTAGVSGLLVISMIALAAPVLAAGVQRARVPEVVIEIVAGIVVGPSVLGWVKIDQPVGLVALLGLAFLLFLAGLEVDLKVITRRLRAPLAGYAASLLLGSAAGLAFHAAGWVRSPLFLAITLSSSSLGLVVPVLADARQARTLLGQLIIAGATIAEFGAITLLSLFFSATRAGTASNAITFGIFGVATAAVGLTLSRADRSLRLDAVLTRLQDTTAEIRVRIGRRAPGRIRCPRGEDRTADHPRRLPRRRHPQHRRPRHGQSPALPDEARRAGLRLPHPGVLRLQRRPVRPHRPDGQPLCAG